jgi:hypothetical protein
MRLMKAIPRSASVLSEHVPKTFCMTTSCISLTYALKLFSLSLMEPNDNLVCLSLSKFFGIV